MKNTKYKLYTCEKTKSLDVKYGIHNYLDNLKSLSFDHIIVNPLGEVDFGIVHDTVLLCLYGDGCAIIGKLNHSLKRDDFYSIKRNSFLKIINNSPYSFMCLVKVTTKDLK